MPEAKTVLHIEDNFDNRLLVRRLLQAAGYTVFEAENANSALGLLKNLVPDLILMDINMPDIDGYALTSQIKNVPSLRQVPVVAITANVMRGDREKVFRAGCNGYIEKPIDVDKFLDQVSMFL
jgi:two-component system, cell cycle response regulator DivK